MINTWSTSQNTQLFIKFANLVIKVKVSMKYLNIYQIGQLLFYTSFLFYHFKA